MNILEKAKLILKEKQTKNPSPTKVVPVLSAESTSELTSDLDSEEREMQQYLAGLNAKSPVTPKPESKKVAIVEPASSVSKYLKKSVGANPADETPTKNVKLTSATVAAAPILATKPAVKLVEPKLEQPLRSNLKDHTSSLATPTSNANQTKSSDSSLGSDFEEFLGITPSRLINTNDDATSDLQTRSSVKLTSTSLPPPRKLSEISSQGFLKDRPALGNLKSFDEVEDSIEEVIEDIQSTTVDSISQNELSNTNDYSQEGFDAFSSSSVIESVLKDGKPIVDNNQKSSISSERNNKEPEVKLDEQPVKEKVDIAFATKPEPTRPVVNVIQPQSTSVKQVNIEVPAKENALPPQNPLQQHHPQTMPTYIPPNMSIPQTYPPFAVYLPLYHQLPQSIPLSNSSPPASGKSRGTQTNGQQSESKTRDEDEETNLSDKVYKSATRKVIDDFVYEHIKVLNDFVEMNRQMMESFDFKPYHYTTLDDYKDYVKLNRNTIPTYEEALEQVKNE